tara:strand:- start:4344 stop:4655 length:312 start_codon:yes stop_codon:yes gene_type:complete
MASKSKIKGNAYERELVIFFKQRGYDAERARGSDGRSLGMAEDVDGYFKITPKGKKIKFQAKRRRVIPKWLQTGNSDIVLVREDRGNTQALLDLDLLLKLIGK